MTTIVTTVTS